MEFSLGMVKLCSMKLINKFGYHHEWSAESYPSSSTTVCIEELAKMMTDGGMAHILSTGAFVPNLQQESYIMADILIIN